MATSSDWRAAWAHGPVPRLRAWIRASPWPVDVAIAAALTASFATWSLLVLLVARPAWSPVLGAAALTAPAALAVRRARPAVSFAVVSVASAVLVAPSGTSILLPSLAAFPVSLYSYCAWAGRDAPAVGLAVGAGGALAAAAHLAIGAQLAAAGLSPLFPFGFLLAVVLVTWSLGMFRRVQLAYIAALRDRALQAEAEREERARRAVVDERARIARETHDIVAHSLSVIVSQAQGGVYAGRADPGRAIEVLGRIAETGRQALGEMRRLLEVVRDDTSPWEPQPTLAELPDLLHRVRRSGLTVAFAQAGAAGGIGPAAELAAYRVVQEALTNTLRHGGAGATADVRLEWTPDALLVTVRDDGRGSPGPRGAGRGLVGMRERVAAAGGSLATGPAPGGGFLVQARLPRAP
jgi:signal transduction histidine kinase